MSTDGSWEAGVDGALPGHRDARRADVGDAYRQEFYAGQAEDMGEVLAVGGSRRRCRPAASTTSSSTQDWNPLEPDVIEEK